MNDVTIVAIICEYAYNGLASGSPVEKYEVTPIKQGSDYSVKIKNIDRCIEKTLKISQVMYEKIVLASDADSLSSYITTAYGLWKKEGKI